MCMSMKNIIYKYMLQYTMTMAAIFTSYLLTLRWTELWELMELAEYFLKVSTGHCCAS